MVLLSTSNPNGKAHIMTANLDGETNLKTFSATSLTCHMQTPEQLANDLDAVVECENPNADLGRFVGRLKAFEKGLRRSDKPKSVGLGSENIVLRGTQLKVGLKT